jgi:hypothetical protein
MCTTISHSWSTCRNATEEECKSEYAIAVRARVHDLLLEESLNIFPNLSGSFFFECRVKCHFILAMGAFGHGSWSFHVFPTLDSVVLCRQVMPPDRGQCSTAGMRERVCLGGTQRTILTQVMALREK